MKENSYQPPKRSPQGSPQPKRGRVIVALWVGVVFNTISAVLACSFLLITPEPGLRIKPGMATCPFLLVTLAAMAAIWPQSLRALAHGKWVVGLVATLLAITPLPLFLAMSELVLRFKGISIGRD
jgi:hypothetical protein